MYKAGLIFGALTLLVAAGAAILSPLCAPCAVIFLGLGAGYVAGVFDKPPTSNATSRTGAIAGAVGGVGAVLGQMMGAAINGSIMGPQGAEAFARALGLPGGGPGFTEAYWVSLFGGGLCLSLLDVLLMAAFGALGAYVWWRTGGRGTPPPIIIVTDR